MPAGDLGKTYHDEEIIFNEGEIGECMYVVLQGKVEIFQIREGREMIVGVCREGEFLGEMAVLTHETRSAGARALGSTRLMSIDKKNFLRRVHEDPTIAFRLVETLSQRIRNQNEEIQVLNRSIQECLTANLSQNNADQSDIKRPDSYIRD